MCCVQQFYQQPPVSMLQLHVSATGNVIGGNVLTGGLISATGNIAGSYFIGNGARNSQVLMLLAYKAATAMLEL
jgi:hypothetical protein